MLLKLTQHCKSTIFVQSVAQSCLTLCNPMGCSITGFPILRYLLELAQTHVHCVNNAIQPSHPLSTSSPPAFNLSQHQHLLQWVISSYQVAKVLELQHKSFQLIFRTELIYDWLVWSPCSPRDSQDISPTPRFESVKFLALSFPYSPTLTFKHDFWKNHSFDYVDFCWQVMSLFFTMLSLLVISSIPRSKHLLISWLKSPYAVILEPLKVKSVTVSIVYPIYLPWSNGTPERMKG